MKLKREYEFGTTAGVYSIPEAVEHVVTEYYGDSRGAIEDLEIKVSNLIKLSGKLLETLHDKHVLNTTEVLEFLRGFEAAE